MRVHDTGAEALETSNPAAPDIRHLLAAALDDCRDDIGSDFREALKDVRIWVDDVTQPELQKRLEALSTRLSAASTR